MLKLFHSSLVTPLHSASASTLWSDYENKHILWKLWSTLWIWWTQNNCFWENSRVLLKEVDIQNGELALETWVQLLSRGSILNIFMELMPEVKTFLSERKKSPELLDCRWLLDLAFHTDMTTKLNNGLWTSRIKPNHKHSHIFNKWLYAETGFVDGANTEISETFLSNYGRTFTMQL